MREHEESTSTVLLLGACVETCLLGCGLAMLSANPFIAQNFLEVITIIKSRRVRCAGHVARMGEKRNSYRILVRNPKKETAKKT
jgi:hypothetical protein